ncbi:hypothetical protein PGB90_003576 [Kerria lacca]
MKSPETTKRSYYGLKTFKKPPRQLLRPNLVDGVCSSGNFTYIFEKNHKREYKHASVQATTYPGLLPTNRPKRLEFCSQLLDMLDEELDLDDVFFNDEAHMGPSVKQSVRRQTKRYCSPQNVDYLPYQRDFKRNVG